MTKCLDHCVQVEICIFLPRRKLASLQVRKHIVHPCVDVPRVVSPLVDDGLQCPPSRTLFPTRGWNA
eukprot:2421714-Amphidinium_carterae.2